MNPQVDTALRRLSTALRGTEWDGKLWLVGGAVRDQLLGISSHSPDIDLVLEGDAPAVAEALWRFGIADHKPVTFPKFGTAMLHIDGIQIELVTARTEIYHPGSRRPKVIAGTLATDASRRDFTVNTLLQHLDTREIVDPLGTALDDLKSEILRTPCDPEVTFTDDPLRMLRACRFAAKLNFTIEPSVEDAIRRNASRLSASHGISFERIRDEFIKTLMSDGAGLGFSCMRHTGLLVQFLPELASLVGVTQNAWHAHDVWSHTLLVLINLPTTASLTLRLAALFHDIAKPQTRLIADDGSIHFYGHEAEGAKLTRVILGRLKFDSATINDVVALVGLHMRYGQVTDTWSDTAVRRLVRAVGPYRDALFTLVDADSRGTGTPVEIDLEWLHKRLDAACDGVNVAEIACPVDGHTLVAACDLPAGPWLGAVKAYLIGLVVDGDLSPTDTLGAIDLAKAYVREGLSGVR